ncbi:hypothetical protein JYU34_015506 [Plutella xylostella]|uniref:Uncharacterized protein n=1 Tax=Plutella xylostella TaxID=51655 RepID=A0ABQ7Q786_PLUXY|nr:hypothetical protein JYU34_015506 [Plutella xylostella]
MSDLKICRICLRTEAKVYKFDQFQLKSYYEEVMALKISDADTLPSYVCYECATLLHKFHKFKEKCYSGLKALREIAWRGPLSYEAVYKLDRAERNLQSSLEIMTVTNRIKSYTLTDHNLTNFVKTESNKQNIEVNYIGENNEDKSSLKNVECGENSHDEISDKNVENSTVTTQDNQSIEMTDKAPVTIFIDIKKEGITTEPLKVKQERRTSKEMWSEQDVMNYASITPRRTRYLDANYWKKYVLSEEEALKEFRARTEDAKYLKAAFKCTDCFKGFSKKEMLNRHVVLRHNESIGVYECRVCKMRFKWASHRRVHARQHYARYRCLRCPFMCPLENTALLHEEYHSGVTRKCIHCNEEFRHASTYYTHVRTAHRAAHACVSCGACYGSRGALRAHAARAHPPDAVESPDDDDPGPTACERCDVTFASARAYEEHLFHSIMHTDGVEDQMKDDFSIPRKVLGKRERAKITKELRRKRNSEEDPKATASETKRKKKVKRKRRKPTTCHQCGLHFPTQQACMRHHVTSHPGTSFHPARHVCEICGASLAPGSVAVHQNMHSRARLHSCGACHKQFHSLVGLKRHSVTHTGEKPFECPECHKRFTQSNSMKLHHRTKHLQQPYPKRNRRKKPTPPEQPEESSSSSSASCLSSPPQQLLETVHDKLYTTL